MSPSRPPSGRRSLDLLISRLAARWREEAEMLHRRGADEQAVVLKSCANELEEEARFYSLETLTLGQAAEESGYSYSALEKMVRSGRIPNAHLPGQPRIRRGDLPKKPGSSHEPRGSEPDLAELVLAGNSSPSHIS
jgi:hypothetical protein